MSNLTCRTLGHAAVDGLCAWCGDEPSPCPLCGSLEVHDVRGSGRRELCCLDCGGRWRPCGVCGGRPSFVTASGTTVHNDCPGNQSHRSGVEVRIETMLNSAKASAWDEGAASRQCQCSAYSEDECACGGYPSELNPYRGSPADVLDGTGVTANTWQSAARRLADENRALLSAFDQLRRTLNKIRGGAA